jgi:hypothetical protein
VEGAKFTVVDPEVPKSSVENLRGTSEAITAKLSISQLPDKNYAICTKTELSGFSLSGQILKELSDDRQPKSGGKKTAAFAVAQSVSSVLPANTPGQTTTPLIAAPAGTCAEQAAQDAAGEAAKANCKKSPNDPACKEPPVFSFTTRSLDSMIYYLGEDLRANDSIELWDAPPSGTASKVKLFRVKQRDGMESFLVSTEFRGVTYIIPDSCSDAADCDLGRSHRSLQVLSLLNQIWGLQKEATDTPSIPVVSVVGH